MTINTGWTPEITELAKLQNELCGLIASKREARKNWICFNGPNMSEYYRNRIKNAIYKIREFRILQLPALYVEALLAEWDAQHANPIQARAAAIIAQLGTPSPTDAQIDALNTEFMEYMDAAARDGGAIGDERSAIEARQDEQADNYAHGRGIFAEARQRGGGL